MQIKEIYHPHAIVSFGSQCRGGIGWVAHNGLALGEGGDFHHKC